MKFGILFSLFPVLAASTVNAGGIDYTNGVFIVNEDWYGHQNSTVNYLMPDDVDGNYWHYRVIQNENPGIELGCTNQYGAIWDGKFYFIAKQAKDPGAAITGGRITVADAKTMKVLYQTAEIDPEGTQCDGRGFLGIDSHKGYISSSNGIWILDLDTFQVKGQVKGTANPNIGDDKLPNDPTGSLYHGQSGSMVYSAGKVFAAHQQYGMLVIDPVTDTVTKTISMDMVDEKAGIGSVILAKDGSVWASVAKTTQGNGATLPYIVRVEPATLSCDVISIPSGMYPPSNSWYAWTPDSFCASSVTNSLYWAGGSNAWFSNTKIFRYDIDLHKLEKIIDLDDDNENWKLYGCSMRLHPVTDEIYMSLYHEYGQQSYITRRYTANGEKIKDYPMIANYWFPSLPVFPETSESGIANIEELTPQITCHSNVLSLRGLQGQLLDIYNCAGVHILSQKIESDNETATLDLKGGLYIIRCGRITTKIALK